jgi:hypothetical protein
MVAMPLLLVRLDGLGGCPLLEQRNISVEAGAML